MASREHSNDRVAPAPIFRAAIEHSEDVVIAHDLDGRLVFANDCAIRSLRYSRAVLLGLRIWDIDPVWTKGFLDGAIGALRTGRGMPRKGVLRRSDSEEIVVESCVSLVEDSGRSLVLRLARAVRVDGEAAIWVGAEQLRDLVDNLPAGAVLLDGAGLYLNRAAREITGIRAERVADLDTWFRTLYGPAYRDLRQTYQRDKAAGFPRRTTVEIRRADGATRFVEFAAYASRSGEIWLLYDVTERRRAEQELRRLKSAVEHERDHLRRELDAHRLLDFVAESPAIHEVLEQVRAVAVTDASVLITGESGVGKEHIARAVHEHSLRAQAPFVRVNCASIPGELFESEFFGHIKGAFTGALNDRAGRFQLADRGTIFLDEVGEIPLELQSKLLRVLQDKEFERVGEGRPRRVDVRIVAATNRDLEQEVEKRRLREDLFYRLNVFPIAVPPLRDRVEDIVPIARCYLSRLTQRYGWRDLALSDEDAAALREHDWPGNVRELQNALERAAILSKARGGPLQLRSVLGPRRQAGRQADIRVRTIAELKELERQNIVAALEQSGWKLSGKGSAGELLGLSRTTLASKLKSLGIEKP
ncbi:MAG: sigma 54-interacting transcriptional regulator [Proteobacteria bacterium]|nr:sigma 54-interacting transcriptional regulator [Pseudomonadota bacterium]